jgi:hypothetical protein
VIAKGDNPGLVRKGFQIKNSPADGADKVIFETLEDLTIDPALNGLQVSGGKLSQEALGGGGGGGGAGASGLAWLETRWIAATKPEVVADEVAMIIKTGDDIAEAVSINRVEATGADDSILKIDLLPSPVQYHWSDWRKGETALHYAPRWQKKCWLNGDNVIRTREPHGLSAGAYIGWDINKKNSRVWDYGNMKFAEVLEADKRNLRLRYSGDLPEKNTELVELLPIQDSIVAASSAEVVLLDAHGNEAGRNVLEPAAPKVGDPPGIDHIFSIEEITVPVGGGGLLPPASLPSIGSFLFPSPMLPMDLVKAAVELMLSLGVMQIPSTGEIVIKGLPVEGMLEGLPGDDTDLADVAENLFNMLNALSDPDSGSSMIKWYEDAHGVKDSPEESQRKLGELLAGPVDSKTISFQELKGEIEDRGPLLTVPKGPTVIAIVDSPIPLYVIEASADKVRTGDWVVAEFSPGLRALKVDAVNILSSGEASDSFALSFENLDQNPGELWQVYADFRRNLLPEKHSFNNTEISGDEIELEKLPPGLKVCDFIMLTADGKPSILAKIVKIDGDKITTEPPATGFTRGELVVRGNVVLAGHGESKPGKILGSGDAAKSNQEFVLQVDNPSFITDATMSSGVAAAIDVEVAGRLWEQVSSLKDSIAEDHHYTVRVTEAGHLKIIFGDGQYGRRLPSGKNNLRVGYRVGSGISGNLPAHSLEKPVNPHPLVDMVLQYQPSVGGGNLEDLSSLRENAPATLLALERAVSLSDFSHLAAARSSVWQAKAYQQVLQGGRLQGVTVVIVPAGGESSDKLERDLESYLQQHAVPGIQVNVTSFEQQRFSLALTLRVNTDAFITTEVETAVSAALVEHFALQNRALGEHLYISEIYKLVENVQGVENSIAVLDGDPELKVVNALNDNRVVYLDTSASIHPSELLIVSEEYRP